jgi:hypothetical protein
MTTAGRVPRLRATAALLACLPGCLYDPDDVCSPNQEIQSGRCVCVEGAVPAEDGEGCTPCGAHEVVSGDTCACMDGYARVDDAAPCEPIPAGLGAACDPGGLTCSDQDYDYCHQTDDAAGYCTSAGCASSQECPPGYACAEGDTGRYCQRPPTGQGLACESSADCAGYEASYCETFQAHICLVSGCSLSPDTCFEGWQCCDLSSLGLDLTLCVEQGLCPTS